MTKDMLLKDHPELAAQAGLVKQTKVSKKDKKRKQYLHEGTNVNVRYQGDGII
jgi:hypothetical protein